MKENKHKHFSKKHELSDRDLTRLNNEVFAKKMKYHREDNERIKREEQLKQEQENKKASND